MNKPFDLETVHPLSPKKPPKSSTFKPETPFELPTPLETVITPAPAAPPQVETPAEGTPLLVVLCRLFSLASLVVAGMSVNDYLKFPKDLSQLVPKDSPELLQFIAPLASQFHFQLAWTHLASAASCLAMSLAWWIAGEFLVLGTKSVSLLQRIKG